MYLLLLLAKVRLTIVVDVTTHRQVRWVATFRGNWRVAERTHWHLHVLLVRTWAGMLVVEDMIRAKYWLAGVALHWQEVEAIASWLGAVLADIWKLHNLIWKKKNVFLSCHCVFATCFKIWRRKYDCYCHELAFKHNLYCLKKTN